LILLGFYSVASWFSLFWKSGIISYPLATGGGALSHLVWSSFFNPSFWPMLLCRTVISLALAALGACAVVHVSWPHEREARRDLMGRVLRFLAPVALLPVLGAWFWASLPVEGHSRVSDGNTALALVAGFAVVASLAIGACGLSAFWHGEIELSRLVTALLCLLVSALTVGGEWVCDRSCGPASVRAVLPSSVVGPDGPAEGRR
jgi:hypothetical protein